MALPFYDNPYGYSTIPGTAQCHFDQAHDLGWTNVRVVQNFSAIDTNKNGTETSDPMSWDPSSWNFSIIDSDIQLATANRINHTFVLDNVPAWGRYVPAGSRCTTPSINPAYALLAIQTILNRYNGGIKPGIVARVESANEGFSDKGFGDPCDSFEEFVLILQQVYPWIKSNYPNVLVGTAAHFNRVPQDVVTTQRSLYTGRHGSAKGLFDYSNYHWYGGAPPDNPPGDPTKCTFFQEMQLIHQVDASFGNVVDIYVTESGLAVPSPNNYTEQDRMNFYQTEYDDCRLNGWVTHHYAWTLQNSNNESLTQGCGTWQGKQPTYDFIKSYVINFPQWSSGPGPGGAQLTYQRSAVNAYSVGDIYNAYYANVQDFGQPGTGTGTMDDTAAIQQATLVAENLKNAYGGVAIVDIPAGVYIVSSPTVVNTPGILYRGAGAATQIVIASNFQGACAFQFNNDFCGMQDLEITGTLNMYNQNAPCDAIQFVGARSGILENVFINYINGWAVQSLATSSIANYWMKCDNVHSFQCAQGFHILGVAGSSYNMSHSLVDCIMDQVQNGDAYLFEDCHDVTTMNSRGSVGAGSGNTMHIKGNSAAIYNQGFNLGAAPSLASSATLLIESGTNGTPADIGFNGGILQDGAVGAVITAGSALKFTGVDFYNNGGHGLSVSGAAEATLSACTFNLNGALGTGPYYDVSTSTSGVLLLQGCKFLTPQGSGVQQTAHAVNDSAQKAVFTGCQFTTAAPLGSNPAVVRGCPGYNPVGFLSALAALGASPCTYPLLPTDTTYLISGGTVSAVAIGGHATGFISGQFRVPAQQSITVTYSVAPTISAFGD